MSFCNLHASSSQIALFIFVGVSIPSSSFDVDILPAEGFFYVLINPGFFQGIEEFSYGRILVLGLEGENVDIVKVCLMRTGIFDTFGDDMSAELIRDDVQEIRCPKRKFWMDHALW